ncbi:MAG: hypothetical protein IT308_00770 [Anaerolineaceae bacterium]|nr:hypothetical protein [Anaerolineaceae bacterium]
MLSKQARIKKPLFLPIVFGLLLACTMPQVKSGGGENPDYVEETIMAIRLQGTVEALGSATAGAAKDMPEEATPTAAPKEPTQTAEPQSSPLPPPTEEPAAESTQDIAQRIRRANVLVFEDIRGYYALDTRVHSAVQNMGFSGGRVIEVGDAVGHLMEQLNSSTRWDLIVISAEARSAVRGEFWDLILQQVNNNVALVAEVWYLDEIANGRISPLLGKCGVSFQADWWRDPADYDQLDYSIYWLDQYNEVFSVPNQVGALTTPNIYWEGDAGDLIQLGAGGDAILLAGKHPDRKSSHGVLATCLGGRVILQTYATHDYRRDHTVPLWENFMYYTLNNHFKVVQ